MVKYSLGFAFDKNKEYVILILKNRPIQQKGLLNGIGGKVEFNETPLNSMIREFKEETGVFLEDWNLYCELTNENSYSVFCYYIFSDEIFKCKTQTDEKIFITDIKKINHKSYCMSNLLWLIFMCLDIDKFNAKIIYNGEIK